jgi:DNA-binding SARP family transcriptional activator
MRFSILGPLEVRADDGRPVPVTRPLHRSALALLLLNAGQPCSSASLAAGLWGDEPPNSPDISLRSCVYGIRKLLAASGRVRTCNSAYLITVGAGELDLHEFRDLATRGQAALDAGDPRAAAAMLTQALSLWREPPLADVPAVPNRERLLQQCGQTRGALVDARLAIGEHRQLLAELRSAVAADPLREHAWAQLIVGLYRSGARTEALAAFGRLRVMLIREYGMEPGPELEELHRQVLADDPALMITKVPPQADATAPAIVIKDATPPAEYLPAEISEVPADADPRVFAEPAPADGQPLPAARERVRAEARYDVAPPDHWRPACQLPMAVSDFTGRALPLARLLGRLSVSGMSVTVVAGMLGTGKTTLAVHAAHLARSEFPDGQLYASLEDSGRPRDPQAVLGELLRGTGLADRIPATRFEREALYRSRLAGRRVLILADGASSAAQVRPLLPGSAGSAVVVTSRARLPDLDDARHIELGGLHPADSVRLLAAISGRDLGDGDHDADRFAEEAQAASAIACACGHLPLALRIAGTRLADDPDLTVTHLAGLLSDEHGRLDELAVGGFSLRTRLGAAADGMSSRARRAIVGLAGPRSPEAGDEPRAITLSDDAETRQFVPELASAGLLLRVSGDGHLGARGYLVHPLLPAYAGELIRRGRRAQASSAPGLASGEQPRGSLPVHTSCASRTT